eukprot:tig00000189_g14334.t1
MLGIKDLYRPGSSRKVAHPHHGREVRMRGCASSRVLAYSQKVDTIVHTGHRVELEYKDAILNENVRSLDETDDVESVSCGPGVLRIRPVHAGIARTLTRGTLLVGSQLWGCVDKRRYSSPGPIDKPGPFYRRVLDFVHTKHELVVFTDDRVQFNVRDF